MKQIYLVRASGERIGPYESYREVTDHVVCVRQQMVSVYLLEDLGFTIEPAEEKPMVERHWWLIAKGKTGDGKPWNGYGQFLGTTEEVELYSAGFHSIKDPTRPDPVYLEE